MRRSKGHAYLKIVRYFDKHSPDLDEFSKIYLIGSENWEEGVMHHKFVIIDNNLIWTGSYNFTFQAARNHEAILRIEDTKIAEEFWLETICLTGNERLIDDSSLLFPFDNLPGLDMGDRFCCYWCGKNFQIAEAAVVSEYLSSCKKCYELHEDPYWKESLESY